MESWKIELYAPYLAHAGKPGMKWGYTDGRRNGNRMAELVKLNTGMGIRPARPNGARQIITTRPESGDEHDAPNNSGVRVYKNMNARLKSNVPSINDAVTKAKIDRIRNEAEDDRKHRNPDSRPGDPIIKGDKNGVRITGHVQGYKGDVGKKFADRRYAALNSSVKVNGQKYEPRINQEKLSAELRKIIEEINKKEGYK